MIRILFLLLFFISHISFSQIVGLSGWDIFVDPGHSQTQNMGVSGYSEAEEALRVALHLQDLLLTNTDIDAVYLSRTNDQDLVSLSQRTDMANTINASWYHSIHSNAQSNAQVTNTLLLWGQLYNGQPDPPVGGETMSAIMIDNLTQGMQIPTIGSWGDCSFYTWSTYCEDNGGPYLYVNRNTIMPSELSEEGHHSNPAQNQLHMNEEYKRLLAYTFYWSILEYHNLDRPFVGICTGIVTDGETGLKLNDATVEINQSLYTTDSFESLFHNYSNNPEALRNGFYWFENLPDSTFQIITSKEGYRNDTSFVTIIDDFFTFHNIELISVLPTQIVSTYPENGDSSHNYTHPIFIDFSRSMNPSSVDSLLSIVPAITANSIWLENNHQFRIYPTVLETETSYLITISDGALDAYGTILDGDGDGVSGGEFNLSFTTSTLSTTDLSTLPELFLLSQNYPNPFNPSTLIHFSVPFHTDVTIIIHDIKGNHIRTLVRNGFQAGDYELIWNGKNDHNTFVPSGIYFYTLSTKLGSLTKKMTLLR